MENVQKMVDNLKSGVRVVCPKCKNGIVLPFNTTAEKAHAFNCDNPKCDFRITIEEPIDIE
jgi:uncharacterized protein (DUF983 family)